MNHLQEVVLKHDNGELILKPTHKALYRSLKETKLGNRLDVMLEEVGHMNYDVVFIILKNFNDNKLSVDELMDLNIPLGSIAEALGECIKLISDKRESK